MIYLENNVFDEALNRIRYIFDEFDDVIVSMSGGKDSTVVFHLALMVAKEKNRLPLKVFWLDQEAEWQSTVDYMDCIMRMPEVKPYWFQVPFDFTNGVSPQRMRCSALIHETAWHSIEQLQEFEPETYNRFCKRVPGTNTFSHAFETDVIPKKLPFMFRDWKEYRDYLLVHLVKPEYHELFRKRWQGQDTVEWYKVHVRECIVNDIDGTINTDLKLATRKGGGSVDKRPAHKFSALDSHIQGVCK